MTSLKLENLTKKIGDRIIINNLNINIEEGQMVAITGPSGSGKTTLLNILGLIDSNYNGSYLFGNKKNITANSNNSQRIIRTEISYLFQNFALIENETVSYNLQLALKYVKEPKKVKLKKINEALAKVGLEESLDTKIAGLSGGEQQRIAIVRALLKPSNIILADEPTGSLDSQNRDIIFNLLNELNQNGKTVIIVTHDEIIAERCHYVIQLNS